MLAFPRRLIPARPLPWWGRLLIGAACLAAAVLVRIVTEPLLGDRVPFISFFPAALAASIWGGALGGGTVLALTPALVGYALSPSMGGYRLDLGSVAAFLIAGGSMVSVGAMLAASMRRQFEGQRAREDAEAQLQTVVSELGHRAKNGLGIVMAIVEQSSRQATDVEDYKRRVLSRLEAMARSQDVINTGPGHPVRLGELLRTVLDPFDLARFDTRGGNTEPEVSADTALGLALIFHELATNAVKYGALSVPDGRVGLDWAVRGKDAEVLWREHGGPMVSEPAAHGFGVRMFSVALRRIGGQTDLTFPPAGAECRVRFPLTP